MGGRLMKWAAPSHHLGGIPRRMAIGAVGAVAKLFTSFLNSTAVYNADALLRLVRHRPPGLPLITISNHMSTLYNSVLMGLLYLNLDDPLLWGFKGFPITDPSLARWVLAAEDICFKNVAFSYFFRLGKCIPITRGGGIYQEHMNEALEYLGKGQWLHTFPEGKVSQEDIPIRRIKWGTASLIARAPVTPVVLPIYHYGFQKVMPENSFFGRRPPLPLCNKNIKIVVGDPIEFDLPTLKQTAKSMGEHSSLRSLGWPGTPHGIEEAGQRWLYMTISEKIGNALEELRVCHSPVK